ncbi:MAG: hypothetical protein LH613_02100 [Chamaesiphon sp.]|nr:hypothetical protein [Chamaesiphon sp.]
MTVDRQNTTAPVAERLGIDEGIKIDRELSERQVDQTFLSGSSTRIRYLKHS